MKLKAKNYSKRANGKSVKVPVRRKRDPQKLEKILDKAIEDSMAASDPPTISNSEVRVDPVFPTH